MKCARCGGLMERNPKKPYEECHSCGTLTSLIFPVPRPRVISTAEQGGVLSIYVDYRSLPLGLFLILAGAGCYGVPAWFLLHDPHGRIFIRLALDIIREMPPFPLFLNVILAVMPLSFIYLGLNKLFTRSVFQLDGTFLTKYSSPFPSVPLRIPLDKIKDFIIDRQVAGKGRDSTYYGLRCVLENGAKKSLWSPDNDPFVVLFLREAISRAIDSCDEASYSATFTKLLKAVEHGADDEAESLLRAEPALVNRRSHKGQTLLTCAIEHGNRAMARLLIDNGASVDKSEGKKGRTPLHFAVIRGDDEAVGLLLSRGASPNVQDREGATPLRLARGKSGITELLEAGGAMDMVDYTPGKPGFQWTLLIPFLFPLAILIVLGLSSLGDITMAARSGNLAWVKILLHSNPGLLNKKVPEKALQGNTPLHEAAGKGHLEMVKFLVEKGAVADAKNNCGDTPLYEAAKNGHSAVMEYLISRGADVKAKDTLGRTILHGAASGGNIYAMRLLTRSMPDSPPGEAAMAAAAPEKDKALQPLAEVNYRDKWGSTPLHEAIKAWAPDVASLLIGKGADVNAKDSGYQAKGKTPLHYACDDEAVRVLVKGGARVNAQDSSGRTPLHYAASEGHGSAVEALIAFGAWVNARDWHGRTPLSFAHKNSRRYSSEVLRRSGGKE
ncbi:MAG: ankyrin repeat domain-containing protein [Candidatus Eremiobacteraeota bacterium]|nr:ankyrin repeat domain-containing protein [Candidatus Eremiobacteraeota bacterium]